MKTEQEIRTRLTEREELHAKQKGIEDETSITRTARYGEILALKWALGEM